MICAPDGVAWAPGVLLLGGSEGGLHENDAAVLAAEGFTVMALAYFGARGLPPGIIDIPLEYFFRALDVLERESRGGQRLGILGSSRGGEAALLVAAQDPRIAAVVSVVGSGIITEGIDFRAGSLLEILTTPTNPWTLRAEPLPYLPYEVSDEMRALVAAQKPVGLGLAFPPVPADSQLLDQVSIPVERINGSILLLSAARDRMWPSSAYSQVAFDRLTAHGRSCAHHVFDKAGHGIAGPPRARASGTTSPGPGVTFALGGTARDNADARLQAWSQTVRFLRQELSPS